MLQKYKQLPLVIPCKTLLENIHSDRGKKGNELHIRMELRELTKHMAMCSDQVNTCFSFKAQAAPRSGQPLVSTEAGG